MKPRLLLALLLATACASTPPPAKPKKTVLLTEYDDARVGRESSEDVKAELGVLDDPALSAYVDSLGRKLLRGIPRRGFDYQFFVIDMMEPNAFALPGGYIFLSRGLLALANSEDELACVMGHEITHAARRHAAAQQALESRQPPFAMPWVRAGRLAQYSREMEREADEGGQILCAAAGYDPMGMSTFLTSLANAARLEQGYSRVPGFFDSHPGSEERAAADAVRAREIRWKRDPAVGDPRAALLGHTDGLEVGQRPEAGIFEGDVFIHPELGFMLRFPPGWRLSNTNRAVGAEQPRGEAIVFLTADSAQAPTGSLGDAAQAWIEKQQQSARIEVTASKPVKVGAIDAWRIEADARGAGGTVEAQLTFIPFRDSLWRITGAAPAIVAGRYQGALLATARSFRPLTEEERRQVTATRLRVAQARGGESIAELSERTQNVWSIQETAVYNALFADHRFRGGETVKIARREPWAPK
jgi:predicted Zn-dependent protease